MVNNASFKIPVAYGSILFGGEVRWLRFFAWVGTVFEEVFVPFAKLSLNPKSPFASFGSAYH